MTSARDMAGQLVQIQVPGQAITAEVAAFIRQYRIGSVILFTGNVHEPGQAAAFTAGLQQAAANAGLPPLLIAIDQEGGGAQTVQVGVSHPPFQMGIKTEEDAEAVGRVLAREVRSMGFNWLYGPVLDVNCNPLNPVIGPRSFGAEPDHVARLGAAFARGVQAEGVLACGKHFPGHGDTNQDSHLTLPFVAHSRARLESVEFAPFRAAIDNGIASLMTAHVVYEALDTLPATLSRAALTGLLRVEMGYDGLVVTDSMVMKAIDDRYGLEEAAVAAVNAGADMVMALGGLERAARTVEAIAAAIESGRIARERAQEAVRRVLAAKAKVTALPHGVTDENSDVEAICRRAVTALNGSPRIRPGERVLVLAPDRVERPMAIDRARPLRDMVDALRSLGVQAEGRDTGMDPTPQQARTIVEASHVYDKVLLCVTEKATLSPGLRHLAEELSNCHTIVVALGGPFPASGFPEALCAFGRFAPSCRAAAAALVGE